MLFYYVQFFFFFFNHLFVSKLLIKQFARRYTNECIITINIIHYFIKSLINTYTYIFHTKPKMTTLLLCTILLVQQVLDATVCLV